MRSLVVTPIVSSRSRRGALALGGLFIAAGAVLTTAPAYADPSAEAAKSIEDRYAAFGGLNSLLGAPIGDAVDAPGGAARNYEGGAIFYSKDTGAHVMYGAILERYKALGGPGSELGYPKNDESDTGDGTGRFNDFTFPGGASMYWTPQWGASVIKGRVLDAWRRSGGITGPFGYPSSDTSILDGVQTGKFVGPEGTEIQWSEAAGLVTVPAALAATIPGISAATPTAEGTPSVTKPSPNAPSPAAASTRSSKWWWIPVGLAALALLGGLLRLLGRKPAAPEPVKVAAQRVPEVAPAPPVAPPPTPRPVAETPPPPRPPAPPTKVVPLVKTPPPAPRPVPPPPPPPVPPAPRPAPAPEAVAVRPLLSEPPKATIHTESAAEDETATVIRYESSTPADTRIQVTYENNAVGHDQESRADKSDAHPG